MYENDRFDILGEVDASYDLDRRFSPFIQFEKFLARLIVGQCFLAMRLFWPFRNHKEGLVIQHTTIYLFPGFFG